MQRSGWLQLDDRQLHDASGKIRDKIRSRCHPARFIRRSESRSCISSTMPFIVSKTATNRRNEPIEMNGDHVYRASTTAPVNIAVIKSVMPPNPACNKPLSAPGHRLRYHSNLQILGETRSPSEPPYQLVPLCHPLPVRPPHPYHRLLFPKLLSPRHPPPKCSTTTAFRRPFTSLSDIPSRPPLRPRIL